MMSVRSGAKTKPPISLVSTQLRARVHSSSTGFPSDAYLVAEPGPSTTTTPDDLTPRQRQTLERIIRVDQAGELGANWIYKGQLAVLKGQPQLSKLIQV